MRALALSSAMTLAACGAATAPPASPRDDAACEGARADAERAWTAVADAARAAAAPPEADAPVAARALAALEAHLAALREEPREVQGDEALELSNAMMDGIDELGGELPDELRARADDAAEALLTDRSRDGSRRAAEGAVTSLEQALVAARPDSAAALAGRRDATELALRARRAAEAYARGVADGDRRADRAEVAPLPDGASDLEALRDAGAEASRDAREACGVPRTLAAPAI